jgi:hypothetical protein
LKLPAKHGSMYKQMASMLCCVLIFLFTSGCAGFKTYEIAKDFNKPRHKRVGLLVARMGNRVYSGVSVITPQTNYANRIPRSQSTASFSEDFVDVYIEDDNRLRESLPDYPDYSTDGLSNIGSLRKQYTRYFKNISPQVYESVSRLLTEKDYEVINVKEQSRSWSKPVSEMTIADICAQLQGTVDALLVLHYMDVGDSYLYTVTNESKDTGFSALSYTISMFDVASRERLLFFRPLFPYRIGVAMAHDPEIISNPALKDKILLLETTERHGLASTTNTTFSYSLSDEEIIHLTMKYVCHGITYRVNGVPGTQEWKGLDTVVP